MEIERTMKIGSLLELPKGTSMAKTVLASRKAYLHPFVEETLETFLCHVREISIIPCGKKHELDGSDPCHCPLRSISACCGHQRENKGNTLALLRAGCFILDAIDPSAQDDGSWEMIASLRQRLMGLDGEARNSYLRFSPIRYPETRIPDSKDKVAVIHGIKERERELGAAVLQIRDAMVRKFERLLHVPAAA